MAFCLVEFLKQSTRNPFNILLNKNFKNESSSKIPNIKLMNNFSTFLRFQFYASAFLCFFCGILWFFILFRDHILFRFTWMDGSFLAFAVYQMLMEILYPNVKLFNFSYNCWKLNKSFAKFWKASKAPKKPKYFGQILPI